MAFHCTNCNGSMVFDVASQQMKCLHCGSTCDPQEFVVREMGVVTCGACGATIQPKDKAAKFCPHCGKQLAGTSSAPAEQETTMARFACQNCGAELEGTEDSLIGFCPYCGGQSMVKGQAGAHAVERIVPFQVSKDRCVDLYQTYTKGVRFLPKELRDPTFIQRFTGIYMPFYTYDIRFGRAELTGHKTVVSTSKYDEVHYYALSARATGDYRDGVAFDGSRYLDDEISQRVQPFDTRKQAPFNPAYLAGFYADASTVDASLYNEDAHEQAAQDLRDSVANAMGRTRGISVDDTTNGIETSLLGSHRVLYPLWFLTWRKDDRVAYAVINGESGSVVSDLPLDLRSFAVTCAAVSVVLFALLELLFQPTPMVTSLISLGAALAMGFGIRSAARREYEKQVHANDKGWSGTNAQSGPGAQGTAIKRRRRGKDSSMGEVLAIVLFFALPMLGGLILGDELDFAVGALRYAIPLVALGFSIYVGAKVVSWHRYSKSRDALAAAILLIVTVVLNAAIVLIAPVNDGWYYIGDAICIVGLLLTSIAMIRLYNLGTTRPLPKLFDRAEVEQ